VGIQKNDWLKYVYIKNKKMEKNTKILLGLLSVGVVYLVWKNLQKTNPNTNPNPNLNPSPNPSTNTPPLPDSPKIKSQADCPEGLEYVESLSMGYIKSGYGSCQKPSPKPTDTSNLDISSLTFVSQQGTPPMTVSFYYKDKNNNPITKVVRNNNYTFYTKKESAGLFGEFNYEYDQNGVFLRSWYWNGMYS